MPHRFRQRTHLSEGVQIGDTVNWEDAPSGALVRIWGDDGRLTDLVYLRKGNQCWRVDRVGLALADKPYGKHQTAGIGSERWETHYPGYNVEIVALGASALDEDEIRTRVLRRRSSFGSRNLRRKKYRPLFPLDVGLEHTLVWLRQRRWP